MKKIFTLTGLLLLLITSNVNAFTSNLYITIQLPTLPIPLPTAVIGVSENIGINSSFPTFFIPDPFIGIDGLYVGLIFSGLGYVDESIYVKFYNTQAGGFAVLVGVATSQLGFKTYSPQTIKQQNSISKFSFADVLATPHGRIPTKDDLASLKPILLSARDNFPEYKAPIDKALELIELMGTRER